MIVTSVAYCTVVISSEDASSHSTQSGATVEELVRSCQNQHFLGDVCVVAEDATNGLKDKVQMSAPATTVLPRAKILVPILTRMTGLQDRPTPVSP